MSEFIQGIFLGIFIFGLFISITGLIIKKYWLAITNYLIPRVLSKMSEDVFKDLPKNGECGNERIKNIFKTFDNINFDEIARNVEKSIEEDKEKFKDKIDEKVQEVKSEPTEEKGDYNFNIEMILEEKHGNTYLVLKGPQNVMDIINDNFNILPKDNWLLKNKSYKECTRPKNSENVMGKYMNKLDSMIEQVIEKTNNDDAIEETKELRNKLVKFNGENPTELLDNLMGFARKMVPGIDKIPMFQQAMSYANKLIKEEHDEHTNEMENLMMPYLEIETVPIKLEEFNNEHLYKLIYEYEEE